MFDYRRKNEERIISQRILDNLFDLSKIIGWDKKKDSFKLLSKYVGLIDTMVTLKSNRKGINESAVNSFLQLKNLEKRCLDRSQNYPSYGMVSVMSVGYGAEAIK